MTNKLVPISALVLAVVSLVVALNRDVVERVVVGAMPGPEISSPFLSIDGVKSWYFRPAIYTSTTSPIVLRTPAATTTLMAGSGCHLTTSSTTAKQVVFAKGLTHSATTTFLFGANSGASAPLTVVASTSLDAFVFGPSQYLNMSMVGGAGVDSPAGFCAFEFRQLVQ